MNMIHSALKVVADINQQIYDNTESGVYNYLILETDGNLYEIKYLGNVIFSSEEDPREKDESLMDFLWDKIFEIHDDISIEKKWMYSFTSENKDNAAMDIDEGTL